MRTLARAAATLALAVLMAVGVTGVAWATFTGSSSSPANVSTLLLQPPSNVISTGCSTGKKLRTLDVGFTTSTSVRIVNNRPPSTPAKVLTYNYRVTNDGGPDVRTGTLSSTQTGFSVTQDTGNGNAARSWTVTITSSYAGWTSAPVVRVLSC